jgi:hypothetical protein
MKVSIASACVVGMAARVFSIAARKVAKSGCYLPYRDSRLANPHSRSIRFRLGE